MSAGEFDNTPQWYIAMARGFDEEMPLAGKRLVVACGQRELWQRVRSEINANEKAAWWALGGPDGEVSLAQCFECFVLSRENYGADLNHLLLELAQLPAFASFLLNAQRSLCNFVSNPLGSAALPREPYSQQALARLARRVEATLDLEETDWWQ